MAVLRLQSIQSHVRGALGIIEALRNHIEPPWVSQYCAHCGYQPKTCPALIFARSESKDAAKVQEAEGKLGQARNLLVPHRSAIA